MSGGDAESVQLGTYLRPFAHRLASGLSSDTDSYGQDMAMHEARLLFNLVYHGGAPDAPVLYLHDLVNVSAHQGTELSQLITDRLDGKPISRMRGWREFFGYIFCLNDATLDPRPDSEILIETALKKATSFSGPDLQVLDMGTGTGCLLLSFLAEMKKADRQAYGTGLEKSALALDQARDNACRLGLELSSQFIESDWDSALPADTCYQIIFCNPPYIATTDASTLSDDVMKFDPHAALFAGSDGLSDWPAVLQAIARRLHPSGHAFVEIGAGQERAVEKLASALGLIVQAQHRDLSGHIRCLEFIHHR